MQRSDQAQAHASGSTQPTQTGGQNQRQTRRWYSSISQVASETAIHIGDGRYAHFRRDRRFAQVQVIFTAPQGVDPNPSRELTDQFKKLGWTWRSKEPGKPWIYQLDKSSLDDPTARGDSRDALHEQFLLIIQEYRQKHGMPPTIGWRSLADSDTKPSNKDRRSHSNHAVASQPLNISEKQILPSPAGETRGGGEGAAGMLDAFASVGAERFDLTFTDAAGEKAGFRGNRTLEQLRPAISEIVQEAAERQHNVIVRPRSSGTTLIQLDDLGEHMATRLRPMSFLILRTSPGNYQAWIAVADGDADFARRLRKGAGADLTASGASRVSGSVNFKEKYTGNFPQVETIHAGPGLVVTQDKLEALGVVAPPDRAAPAAVRAPLRKPGAKGWPNYQRCVENAPPTRSGDQHDISRADFTFCLLAMDWGWGVEETAARLMQESAKAQENGEAYALRTARNAATALEKRSRLQR
ncbi:MAG TPA: DNA-primase RepB domain-containing protein [Gemmataceae bacterium]